MTRTTRPLRYLVLTMLLALPAVLVMLQAMADNPAPQLVMTGSNRAIVIVDGNRLVLSVGDVTAEGIELLEANSDQARLLINNEEVLLGTNDIAAPVLGDADAYPAGNVTQSVVPKTITLWADPIGFFFANGKVGRNSARFLVDTGANTVTFSSQQADQLGIKYKDGANAFASTASGIAPIKSIVLKKLTIEGITLRNVAANVVLGNFPEVPLLGGSFLNRLDMSRTGRKMELSRN